VCLFLLLRKWQHTLTKNSTEMKSPFGFRAGVLRLFRVAALLWLAIISTLLCSLASAADQTDSRPAVTTHGDAPVLTGITFTNLYTFSGGDSQQPLGELVADDGGILYGTTSGDSNQGKNGTIFKITPDGQITTIYTFTGGTDGKNPTAGLVRGRGGNFYGTTYGSMGGKPSYGTIFRLTPKGELTTLHTFNGRDGWGPGPLMQASDGNFYGTTEKGGSDGTIFKITPGGQFTNSRAQTGIRLQGLRGRVPKVRLG
jgi:uncharacterized repeat protein (TIGR03803 family)